MKLGTWAMGVCLAAGMVVPATAQDVETAASLRRLDMMLMVTSLRCRFGEDDFRVEYDRFRASNLPVLRDAALLVTGEFTRQYGKQGAIREFDRMSVAMANYYGAGHPRLDCHQLKQAAAGLTEAQGEAGLVAAAARLLDAGDNAGAQIARR